MIRRKETNRDTATLLHHELSFAATEAYKLLRTNLMFTLPPDKKCRTIGVTSSIRGEGKSTTAINVSYTLSETGKRVLLIDGDLRLPTVAKSLEMMCSPGLSNVLAGAVSPNEAVLESGVLENWHVLPAGDIPPNPTELLGSERMKKLIAALEAIYDFIIIDLPPANVVSDPMVISGLVDGMVVVVRENYTTRRALNSCLSQLAVSNVKVLGFVANDASDASHSYGRYSRYGRYGKYGAGYENSGNGQALKKRKSRFEGWFDR